MTETTPTIPCFRAFTDDELSADLASARAILAKYKRPKRIPASHEQAAELLVRHEPEDYTVLSPSYRSAEARYSHLEVVAENIASGQARRTMRTAAPAWAKQSYWASDYYFDNGEDEQYRHDSDHLKVPTDHGEVTISAHRVDTITAEGVATKGEVTLYVRADEVISDGVEISVSRVRGLLRQLGIEDDA